MLRPRFILVYQERRLPLPDGEVMVGRALGCHIRFNAPEVSRRHLRLLVAGGRLVAENLSTVTGTKINGRRITGPTRLSHGDEVVLGPRRFRVEVEDAAAPAVLPAAAVADGELPDDVDEATRPGELTETLLRGRTVATRPDSASPAPPQGRGDGVVMIDGVVAPDISFHTCPQCRTRNDFGESTCHACGYAWSAAHPSAVTARITLQEIPRDVGAAAAPAAAADLPVVYASEELTIDALVAELRDDGAFVPSPLLDPPGTPCELTLLPDGGQALTLPATVVAVRSEGLPGMDVRFSDVPAAARAWITQWRAARRR